jgi:septal ring factor EnvC (AmiA/AmiB activator)
MSLLQNNLSRIIVSLFSLFIIVTFCKQPEKPEISSQSASRDSTQTNVQELMLSNQSESDIEENINSLMKLIKEKEAELKKARQEMKLKSVELAQKEEQLAKIESQIKQFRMVSYFILVIGLVLIGIGLFLILTRKKSRQK